jgi:hypothetical protein
MTIRAAPALPAPLALLLAVLAAPLAAQEVELPSGLPGRLFDVILEAATGPTAPDAFTDPEAEEDASAPQAEPSDEPSDEAAAEADPLGEELPGPPVGGLARFRLVVPGLGGEGAGYDAVAGDFAWLCAELALPALAANGWAPTEVVIALSDRETAFGVLDPEAVQFFEGFRIDDGACVPQAF